MILSAVEWLPKSCVLAFHDEQLALFGGPPGIRDEGLLDSALARPRNLLAYEPETPLTAMAASYAWGVVRNHPFIDGNKRTGLLCIPVFLGLNGLGFRADQVDEVRTILRLAAGELSEAELHAWVQANTLAPSGKAP